MLTCGLLIVRQNMSVDSISLHSFAALDASSLLAHIVTHLLCPAPRGHSLCSCLQGHSHQAGYGSAAGPRGAAHHQHHHQVRLLYCTDMHYIRAAVQSCCTVWTRVLQAVASGIRQSSTAMSVVCSFLQAADSTAAVVSVLAASDVGCWG
jgi:hypothetical protein